MSPQEGRREEGGVEAAPAEESQPQQEPLGKEGAIFRSRQGDTEPCRFSIIALDEDEGREGRRPQEGGGNKSRLEEESLRQQEKDRGGVAEEGWQVRMAQCMAEQQKRKSGLRLRLCWQVTPKILL